MGVNGFYPTLLQLCLQLPKRYSCRALPRPSSRSPEITGLKNLVSPSLYCCVCLQPPFTVANIKTLNRIQSRIYKAAMFSNENLLVAAPTGV